MATLDLSGYRMVARRGRRISIDIRPSTQGNAAVGDTLILREGEQYRVISISDPYTTRRGDTEVTLYLEPLA